MPEDWSRTEVEIIVADYLAMLSFELQGKPFSKAEHRRNLQQLLNKRSEGSIERKHSNISAVLLELGFPYISGYKPLVNYQRLLFDVVADRLSATKNVVDLVREEVTRSAAVPPVENILDALVDPPSPTAGTASRAEQVLLSYSIRPPRHIDYLAQEARNSSLGAAGEEFVIKFEIARLRNAGQKKLADRVERVSITQGDGVGFDVMSFEPNGKERFIEAKTTAFGKETPFFVTRNELQFSKDHEVNYYLYRVFQFHKVPKLFHLDGALDVVCALDPVQYIGRVC